MIDPLLAERAEDWRVYAPVLRAKASEWKTLAGLTAGIRGRIAPIIEFVPEWKKPSAATTTRRRRTPQTPDDYVRKVLELAVVATPAGTRSFLYFGHVGQGAIWAGIDLWGRFAAVVPNNARVVPLVDLKAVQSPSLASAIAQVGGEAGFRIHFTDLAPSLKGTIVTALGALRITPEKTHLVFDLKDNPGQVSHAQIRSFVSNIQDFCSITVLAGVFPVDLTHYNVGVTAERRVEWDTWWHEHVATPSNERLLGFGDYTTQWAHYRPSPEVPGSVSLRYCTDTAILVFRGNQANSRAGLGYEQIHGHCRLLVRRPDYDGAVFSVGDHRINCWTDPSKGPGNPEQWRTAGLVHHITHVVAQLYDPTGSSATVRAWARGQTPAPCK